MSEFDWNETIVLRLLGYLSVEFSELHGVEAPRLVDAMERFKGIEVEPAA